MEMLQQENIYLKKMLNEFLESTYKYRTTDFDELKVRDQREIYFSAMSLVNKLHLMTVDKSQQQSENVFLYSNALSPSDSFHGSYAGEGK